MKKFTQEVWRDVRQVMRILLRIMIPVSIVVRLLSVLGWIPYIAGALAPVMNWLGLPGETSIVWASALLTGLYGGLAAFSGLGSSLTLTVAQVSTLAGMMLIAHAFPLELKIAQKAGVRFRFTLFVRLGGALLFGLLTSQILMRLNLLQGVSHSLWHQAPVSTWLEWLAAEGKNYLKILIIVSALLAFLKLLEIWRFTEWIVDKLHPGLNLLGIGKGATPLTIVGLLLGISYGGGLIIKEAHSGKISPRDTLLTLCLLGLCHSLIEDTAIMALIGGDLRVILLGRIVFAFAAIFLLNVALTKRPALQTVLYKISRSRPSN